MSHTHESDMVVMVLATETYRPQQDLAPDDSLSQKCR
jgi:hypothetical protein